MLNAVKKMKNEGINFSERINKNNAQHDVTILIRKDELGKVQELLSKDCEI